MKTVQNINDKGYEVQQGGEVSDTVVSEIQEGIMSDFIPKENLKFSTTEEDREERANQAVIQVATQNGARKIVTLPREGKSLHPKSTLALWKKTYKEYPKIGQKVQTELDEKGFQRIILKAR